jgi:hypothetical protein
MRPGQALDNNDLGLKAHGYDELPHNHTTPFTVVSAYSAWLPQPGDHKATAAPLANTSLSTTKPEIVRGRVVDMALRTRSMPWLSRRGTTI